MTDIISRSSAPAGRSGTAPGQPLGSAIGGLFGLIYVEVNAGALPAPWTVTLRVAAAVAAAGLALLLVLGRRAGDGPRAGACSGQAASPGQAASAGQPASVGYGRGYWLIVAGEAAAIWAGAAVLAGPAGMPRAVVAWVSVVVGAHFLALAALWRLRLFRLLGAAIASCGLAGLVAAFAAAPAVVVDAAGGLVPGFLLLAAGYRGALGLITRHPLH